MKNVIILIISILLILLMGTSEINYLKRTSKYIESDVIYIANLVENDRIEEARGHIEELNKTWHNIKYIWGYFVNYSELDKIDEDVVKLSEYLKLNNKDSALTTSTLLIKNINKIPYRECIKLDNIL